MRKISLFVITLLMIVSASFAQDRYFARTYTSNVLPKGAIDLEFWHTSRFGHKDQFFHAQDQRMELEFGLGKNVQTSFYFNRFQTRSSETPDGTVVSNETGFSNEWKWKLSDPTANKLGFALYGEWGLKGGDELELETKLIFDKIIGKNILALNAAVEYEKEFEWSGNKVESGNWEAPVEFNFGYQYLVKPSLGIGFEIHNHNGIAKGNGWENSVFFGGPTINFRNNRWFIIANYLPQWVNVHKTTISPFSKVLDDQERAEARIIVGISL
ncbi:MAG: hypothetical protein ABIY51_16060 [Ferruginibacter sp.]